MAKWTASTTQAWFAITGILLVSFLVSGCGDAVKKSDDRRKTSDFPVDSSSGYERNSESKSAVGSTRLRSPEAPLKVAHLRDFDYNEPGAKPNREKYDSIVENEFLDAMQNPHSTFSVDVDTASYSNVRRMIEESIWPPSGAVRIEEFVNYFDYQYSEPKNDEPFSVTTDLSACPWEPKHQLLRIGLQGKKLVTANRPQNNLVFLIDVSGSMADHNKLPLVKDSLKMLVRQLDHEDRVAIVTYASGASVVLDSTPASQRTRIEMAIDALIANGSTNGAGGIEVAYEMAAKHYLKNGSNRVILCTDGDFNIGRTSNSELVSLIERRAKTGVFLSVYGFGTGNYNDSTMEKLADNGNGNYGYIDTKLEAYKAFVEQLDGTLFTIAKDVKIQIDFNPQFVSAYRLIGYENRMLKSSDFKDDNKDAGEIGAGHCVTALYELIPPGVESDVKKNDGSRFVKQVVSPLLKDTRLVVSLRYKQPDAGVSQELNFPLSANTGIPAFKDSPSDFQFAASVAAFGMILRKSRFKGACDLAWVQETAHQNRGKDHFGMRGEFVSLVGKCNRLGTMGYELDDREDR